MLAVVFDVSKRDLREESETIMNLNLRSEDNRVDRRNAYKNDSEGDSPDHEEFHIQLINRDLQQRTSFRVVHPVLRDTCLVVRKHKLQLIVELGDELAPRVVHGTVQRVG